MKKIAQLLTCTLIVTALLTSCDWTSPDNPEFESSKKSIEIVTSNNNFGLSLFSRIIEDEEKANVMISPASIALALGMTYNGAETTTRDAFEDVLNYEGLSREEVNEISRNLIEVLVSSTDGNVLEIANSIWYNEGFPVYQDFLDVNSTFFDSEVRELNFLSPSALDEINGWVSDNTHEKITKILDQMDPDTRMILINALYFNCVWEIEFDKNETEMKMFHNDDNTEFGEVEMMVTESSFAYASTEDFRAVALPYKNGKYTMQLLLPASGTSVEDLITQLDGDIWDDWMDEFSEHEKVQVILPKFKFDYDRELGKDLSDMGLREAFSSAADFSGISEIALFISKVLHKTYIDCNEEGTEAAAVTAVVMNFTSAVDPVAGPIVIEFDRPFLFAITENSSKSIVFLGKVSEPEYE